MALSDEDDKVVADYLDQMGITLPVGAGSPSSPKYGVSGIPSAALIDPQGKIAWAGHPGSLSKGTVKDALKGAKKRPSSFLALRPEKEPTGKLAPIGKSMEQGNLAKAQASAVAIAEDPAASEEEKSAAKALAEEIGAHADLLAKQAEGFVKSRDVLKALLVFDAVAKEFGAGPIGEAARKRAAEIRKDPAMQKEIAGAEAFARAQEQARKLGTSKAKGKYQEVVDKHKGTRAAERAQAMLKAKK